LVSKIRYSSHTSPCFCLVHCFLLLLAGYRLWIAFETLFGSLSMSLPLGHTSWSLARSAGSGGGSIYKEEIAAWFICRAFDVHNIDSSNCECKSPLGRDYGLVWSDPKGFKFSDLDLHRKKCFFMFLIGVSIVIYLW